MSKQAEPRDDEGLNGSFEEPMAGTGVSDRSNALGTGRAAAYSTYLSNLRAAFRVDAVV